MTKRSFYEIALCVMIIFLIPLIIDEAYAKTFDVVIPEGAANPNSLIHYVHSEITISVNDKIRWINFDDNTHTVTSGSFQGGPNALFNSGLLESGEVFTYIAGPSDIGTLSYYCTLHPWMNGIITVSDPEGMAVARITDAGSEEAAQGHIQEAQNFVKTAIEFGNTGYDNQAAVSYVQAAINYHNAALEYSLLEDYENAAKFYNESAMRHNDAAIHFEKWKDFAQSVIQHYQSGIHLHFAGVSLEMLGDDENARKHFTEAIFQKRMAQYGSDYIMPPKHQMEWVSSSFEIVCKEGLDLIFKSSTKEPVCVKPETVEKLVERSWGYMNPLT